MSLVVVTGGARSGKSRVALRLATERGLPVVYVAGAAACDAEMTRRIEAHGAERGADVTVVEPDHPSRWVPVQPRGAVVLVDCLGALVSGIVLEVIGVTPEITEDAELEAQRLADDLVAALVAREGDTVVVTNEVGDGVVPAYASGRLFRDLLGRANRALVDAADGAWLVVAGRCIDLTRLPTAVGWPPAPDLTSFDEGLE